VARSFVRDFFYLEKEASDDRNKFDELYKFRILFYNNGNLFPAQVNATNDQLLD
jgi:hypothetical protein